MGEQSPSEILKQLAQEMRCAVAACRNSPVGLEFPFNLNATAGDIMDRVVMAGALDEPKYAHLRVLFEEMKEAHPGHWRDAVWALATSELLPEVGRDPEKGPVGHEDTCAAMANWIDRETAKLQRGKPRKRPKKRGPKGP